MVVAGCDFDVFAGITRMSSCQFMPMTFPSIQVPVHLSDSLSAQIPGKVLTDGHAFQTPRYLVDEGVITEGSFKGNAWGVRLPGRYVAGFNDFHDMCDDEGDIDKFDLIDYRYHLGLGADTASAKRRNLVCVHIHAIFRHGHPHDGTATFKTVGGTGDGATLYVSGRAKEHLGNETTVKGRESAHRGRARGLPAQCQALEKYL
jgi:hypothetical protein